MASLLQRLARLDALAKGIGPGSVWDEVADSCSPSPGARCAAPQRRRTDTIPAVAHRRAWVVATTMVGTVSTILAATIVNVAFPALIREFNIGHDSLQWVATGFLAATTTTMLATSWLVESFGQRRTFVATMAVFLAASLLGAASWNTESLIAARVLQGAAAGVMQPLSMIAVFEVFPLEERGRAMGVFGFGVVLAPAVGPALGGLLTQAFGWRAIFLLSVPVLYRGTAARLALAPAGESRGAAARLRLARRRAAQRRAGRPAQFAGRSVTARAGYPCPRSVMRASRSR